LINVCKFGGREKSNFFDDEDFNIYGIGINKESQVFPTKRGCIRHGTNSKKSGANPTITINKLTNFTNLQRKQTALSVLARFCPVAKCTH
jgi:hypothetical protein